jgi:hypothetical protein
MQKELEMQGDRFEELGDDVKKSCQRMKEKWVFNDFSLSVKLFAVMYVPETNERGIKMSNPRKRKRILEIKFPFLGLLIEIMRFIQLQRSRYTAIWRMSHESR